MDFGSARGRVAHVFVLVIVRQLAKRRSFIPIRVISDGRSLFPMLPNVSQKSFAYSINMIYHRMKRGGRERNIMEIPITSRIGGAIHWLLEFMGKYFN